jgi:hypothetical protein
MRGRGRWVWFAPSGVTPQLEDRMADTRCQLECEDWVRQRWMPQCLGQQFHRDRVRLTSGGFFDFDAVSSDGTTVATISTSGSRTSGGKLAVGKLMKIRSDMLFLLLAAPKRSIMILTERDMYDLCMKEVESGRAPRNIEFFHAPLPPDLATKLQIAKRVSSDEVSPRRPAVPHAIHD